MLLKDTTLSVRAVRGLEAIGARTVAEMKEALLKLPNPELPHRYVPGWGRKTAAEVKKFLNGISHDRFSEPENTSLTCCPRCGISLEIKAESGG